ncbi:ParB/RepB/Spo0J family partition protein [Legionella dresdenensis]|uniref:Probable chromosome-partitioning protein ParB n=1 Tax=Legionella dresdenensis TaxID=450200 RepID=A0ABV8CHQ8_9GAMM
MSVKRGGLGRNLSALLGSSPSIIAVASQPVAAELQKMAIDNLMPGKYQPRTAIDDLSLQELAGSIKQQGVLQPLLVRQTNQGQYEIIAGERRWRASRLAGLTEVPVVVRQVDDETAMAMALVENLQREDLNPVDKARAMARLTKECSLTHQQIAELLSISRAAVSNFMRLLTLQEEVMRLLEHGDLDMGHARALLILDGDKQIEVARLIVAKNLSVRETEKLVSRVKENPLEGAKLDKSESSANPVFEESIKHLAQQLNAKIKLKAGKSGKGSLVIQYDSVQQLEKLLMQIGK